MKKAILVLTMLAGSLATAAQDVKVIPAYWVVETNVKQKNFSIVRMYDGQHNLIHEVKMDGVYLNVSRARHRKMLDQLLKGYYPVMTTDSVQSKDTVTLDGVVGSKFKVKAQSWNFEYGKNVRETGSRDSTGLTGY